jgi:hypothetical protein
VGSEHGNAHEKGREKAMHISAMQLAARHLALVIAVGWIVSSTPAWAGGGGGASVDIQSILQGSCQYFNIANCPKLPTVNQVVVETAALLGPVLGVTPDDVRAAAAVPSGGAIDAGTLPGLANQLGFVSQPTKLGQPIPTPAGNSQANSFLTPSVRFPAPASLTPTSAGLLPLATNADGPNFATLDLTFDYLSRTKRTFAPGEDVGDITLPFVVADADQTVVREVSATLQIRGTGGIALKSDIVGDFLGTGVAESYPDSALGVTFAANFSPNAMFTLSIPILITSDLAPAYVVSSRGYEFDPGLFDGINPVASFLDASFADNSGQLSAAAQADTAIAGDGSVIMSDPVPTTAPEPTTLALLATGLAGMLLLPRPRGR